MSSVETGLPRVRTGTFPPHLTPIRYGLRKEIWALLAVGSSPSQSRLTEFHFRLGRWFDLDFLQIPHWQGFVSMI